MVDASVVSLALKCMNRWASKTDRVQAKHILHAISMAYASMILEDSETADKVLAGLKNLIPSIKNERTLYDAVNSLMSYGGDEEEGLRHISQAAVYLSAAALLLAKRKPFSPTTLEIV